MRLNIFSLIKILANNIIFKALIGIEPMNKILTVLRNNLSAITP